MEGNLEPLSVPGGGGTDFRDVEAFGPDEAVVMGIGRPATISGRRTAATWTRTLFDDSPGVYLDGLAFFDQKERIRSTIRWTRTVFLFPRPTRATWVPCPGVRPPRSTGKRPRHLRHEPGRPDASGSGFAPRDSLTFAL